MMRYFDDVKGAFDRNGIKQPIGCSVEEVEELESKIGFSLPAAYKEYLLFMGKDYKGVMVGTDCFITDVVSNTEYLPELLEENNLDYKLPKNYLAFFCHQGYIMSWFALPCAENNPVCYFFSEGTHELPVVYGGFKQFMTKDILGNAKIEVELRSSKKWWQIWKLYS